MSKVYLDHQDFFEEVFRDIPSCILFHNSGIAVHLEQERVTDLGTLPKACHEVPKYFPIDNGSIILLNDPYCGGGILSNFTLLLGLNLSNPKKKESEFLLGIKFAVRPALVFADNVDAEGLKIPPTPIFDTSNGLNEQIIDAIQSHPSAPDDFKYHLEKNVEELKNLRERLKRCIDIWDIDMSQKALEKYIHQSHTKMVDFLTKIKPQKAQYKENWVTGESVKLEIEKEESRLMFHFSEAENSDNYHLTKAAVFGACFASVMNLLEEKIPLNTGTLECIELKLPKNSFLNSVSPKPVYLGFTEASGLIANFAAKVVSKINKEFQAAEGNVGGCTVDISFEGGKHFYDRLASGLGATRSDDGVFAVDKWTHHDLQASIEDIEKRFPMRIRSTSIRPGSGGNGTKVGGSGMIRSYVLTENAHIKWFSAITGHSPDGFHGGNSGLGPQFLLVRENKKQKLENKGSMDLIAGDRIDILTAGGGGFGDE